MTNDINCKQNQEQSIDMIAAFRQKYSDVKGLSLTQLFLSVWMPAILALIAITLKSSSITEQLGFSAVDISLYVSFYCVVIIFADLFLLTNLINEGKEVAARIQERFDTYVLDLPWNKTLAGAKPDMEDINILCRKFFESVENSKNNLVNWYNPKVSTVAHEKGVLLCQRMNLYWDKSLRESVNSRVKFVLIIWCLFILIIALYQDLSVGSLLLTAIIPLLPVLSYAARLIKENRTSIVTLTRLKDMLEEAWDSAEKNALTIERLREVQNEIYQHRKTNRPVSDRFYWKRKDKHEESSQYSIEKMIEELSA